MRLVPRCAVNAWSAARVPSGVGGSLPGSMYMDTTNGDVYELS